MGRRGAKFEFAGNQLRSTLFPPLHPLPDPRCKMLNHVTPFNVPKCNLSDLVTSLLCLKSDEYINRARENLGP